MKKPAKPAPRPTPRGNRHTGVLYTRRLPLIPVTEEQDARARDGSKADGISLSEWCRRRLFP